MAFDNLNNLRIPDMQTRAIKLCVRRCAQNWGALKLIGAQKDVGFIVKWSSDL
jgi:hypothetical protein